MVRGELPSWGEGWGIGLRFWFERAGKSILGPGKLELLENIDRSHSISAAARQMEISYRHAWELVQNINEAAGEPLVTASTGGVQGGGAQLTPLGHWTISVFRDLLVVAADGYRVVLALPEVDPDLTDKMVLLADREDGKRLGADEGPFRLVVPDDKRHNRWVKRVTHIGVRPVDPATAKKRE